MSSKKEDKLSILLVSDIHESLENVNILVSYCKENKINVDYIFCLGDIMSISQGDQGDQSIYEQKVNELKNILKTLEKICPNLIYLPGNHDFLNLFKGEDSPKLTENSINLHLKQYIIKDDLLLVGIGGAICSLYTDEQFYHAYQNIDKNNIEWKGYPYIDNVDSPNYEKSDQMFKKDLEKIDSYINDYKGNVILLTHVGPFTSSTANQFEGKIIYSGSPSLNDFLIKYENKIIANVHGHTHDAQGISKVHSIKICNPGALIFNRFGILNLDKNIESDYKWRIEKYEQINLIE
jgi:Icc-related predicted phosphoesterase